MALYSNCENAEAALSVAAVSPERPSSDTARVIYHAFISYSRAADGRLAPALQSTLQRFGKPFYRRQILRIFRDQSTLEMTLNVWPEIQRAIDASQFFILLASPDAAKSEWVSMEVCYWLANKPIDRLLIVLTDGSLVWNPASGHFDPMRTDALPASLLECIQGLPNYADLTSLKKSEHVDLKNPVFLDTVASLAARIHGWPKDVTIGEEVKQHRRFRLAAGTAVTLIALLATLAFVWGYVAYVRGAAALNSLGRLLGTEAQRKLGEPVTQQTVPVISALAAESWRLSRSSDAWNALQRMPAINVGPTTKLDGLALRMVFSPDGERLAIANDWTVRMLSTTDLSELARIKHDDNVQDVAFSSDGHTLATASGNMILVFAAEDGRELASIGYGSRVTSIAFSTDGKRLAVGTESGEVSIVVIESRRELAHTDGQNRVERVAFSPDDQFVAIASMGLVRLIDAENGHERRQVNHDGLVRDVAFSPDGRLLATATGYPPSKGVVRILTADGGRELSRIDHDSPVFAMAFSPDGRTIASACPDGTARVHTVKDGRELARVSHEGAVQHVAFSPDGERLATLSNAVVQLAAIGSRRSLAQLTLDAPVWAAAFSPDGGYLAAAAWDPGGHRLDEAVWDSGEDHDVLQIIATDGREVARINHAGKISVLAFSPDGKYLAATGSGSMTVRVFTVENGSKLFEISRDDPVWAAAFNPDGQRLAIAGGDINKGTGEVLLVRVQDGQELARFPLGASIQAVAFSPDGQTLAVGTDEGNVEAGTEGGSVRIVDVADGHELKRIDHRSRLNVVAFSPDGQYLATATQQRILRIFTVREDRELLSLPQENLVNAVSFSPDGKWLALAEYNGTARVLELPDGHAVARVTLGGPVFAATFIRGGTQLATASWDGIASFWSTDLDDLLKQFCASQGRNLSLAEWRQQVGDIAMNPTCKNWPQR